MDRSTLIDLSVAIGENVSYSWNNVLNYNLYLQPSHIKLNSSVYSLFLL